MRAIKAPIERRHFHGMLINLYVRIAHLSNVNDLLLPHIENYLEGISWAS